MTTNSATFLKRTWAEIDLNALENNISIIKAASGGKEIIAVVKANAYGHDDDIICSELWRLGVRYFAVSNLWEAEDLRRILPEAEILVFGYTERDFLASVIENNLIHTVGSVEYARLLNDFAAEDGSIIRTHIKINTGMTRVGIDSEAELDEIMSLQNLRCEAAYTHFAVADSLDDSDIDYTNSQQRRLAALTAKYNLPMHSQNSGGILYHHDFGGQFVRAGIIMYGGIPNTACAVPNGFKLVLTLKSTVCQIKQIADKTSVSYGRTYTANENITAAVIPVGYADGYPRSLSNNGAVIINGKPAPVIGRVCMDQIIVDVTGLDVKTGDEVIIFGGDFPQTNIDKIADKLGTIGYELLCSIGHRVPRIAVRSGKIEKVIRYK